MPAHPQLEQAIAYHQQGELLKAEQLYQTILDESPLDADAWHLLGLIAYQRQDSSNARRLIEQALALNPQAVMYHHNLANILWEQGLFAEAGQHYKQVLQLNPAQTEDHLPLARLAWYQHDIPLAMAHFAQACDASPDKTNWCLEWLQCARDSGQQELFGQILQQLLHYHPQWGTIWNEWGRLQDQLGQEEPAMHAYQQAMAAQPDLFEAHYNHALMLHRWLHIRYKITDTEPVRQAYQQALNLQRHDTLRLLQATLLPVVYRDQAELIFWRERFSQGVAQLLADPPQIANPLYEIPSLTHFFLAYQGQNDRALLAAVAQVYHHFVPAAIDLPVRPERARLKIGFFSNYFYAHSIMSYFAGCILNLPANEFEVVLFVHPLMKSDAVTAQLQAHAAAWVLLPLNDLAQARQAIAAEALDVLVYCDIGMEPLSYLLALTRLAPVQCALSGHPETTGLSTIDYYISSQWWESATAQEHYCESLVTLAQGLPVVYQPPTWWQPGGNRADWGWTDADHVYLCPMPPFKIHPDFDAVLGQILELDPQAVIVFFVFTDSLYSDFLKQRFAVSIPKHFNRIQLRPWLAQDQFLDCVANVDVVLDPLHFGSGVTAYQVLYTGTPIVTCPGAFLRGRGTQALYQQMGLSELTVASPTRLADKAVQVAGDRLYQQALRHQILAGHGAIYQRTEGVNEWSQWLLRIGR